MLFATSMRAQEILDTTVLKCRYTFNHIVNISENKGYSDIMILEIGKNICSFYGERNRIFDSVVNSGALDYMFASRSIYVSQLPKKNINLEIKLYFNFPAGKITVQDMVFIDNYEYTEDIEKINWKILPGSTKQIAGFNCKKAICTFRGRDYEAWYTPYIPISRGPWKFNGLPGLILEVSDSQKQIQFECEKVEIVSVPILKYVSKIADRAKKVDRKEFLNLQKKFYENSAAALSANEVGIGTDANGNPLSPIKNLPYNPIELE